MATNTIRVNFTPCGQEPTNGYRITYRPLCSTEPLRTAPGTFTESPAVFTDTLDPPGTQYEGFIQGDCGDQGPGPRVPFQTDDASCAAESGEVPSPQRVRNELTFLSITGLFTVPQGGLPADTRPVSVTGGFPISPGQGRDASIHPDHDGEADLEVVAYFNGAPSPSEKITVTDSDATVQCNVGGGLVFLMGTLVGQRLANAEDWEVVVSEGTC